MQTYSESFATIDEFITAIKVWRKQGGWIFFCGQVAGKDVSLKTYGHTYMQRYHVGGNMQNVAPMDCKVREFETAIRAPFTGVKE